MLLSVIYDSRVNIYSIHFFKILKDKMMNNLIYSQISPVLQFALEK